MPITITFLPPLLEVRLEQPGQNEVAPAAPAARAARFSKVRRLIFGFDNSDISFHS
ncbi:MAG TPA: hypothetical protein VNX28_08475 [Gemmataceae bacterium]|nr:hypothetical protein [Gemmataceae bacterium]